MRGSNLSKIDFAKAIGAGMITALILSAVTVPAFQAGLAPMPEPPSLAFAAKVLGTQPPLVAGIVFHVGYITTWAVIFLETFADRPSLGRIAVLALTLWALALAVIFPILEWGVLGLAVGPALIPAALAVHVLFAVVFWGVCRALFNGGTQLARASM